MPAKIYKTDLIKKIDALSVKQRPSGNQLGAALQRQTATYTFTGEEADGDIIELGELPVGATLLPDLSKIISEGVGGTGGAISSIGTPNDDDAYSSTSINITSAGINAITPTNASMLSPIVVTEATKRVIAKLALTSGSFTAGKKIRAQLVFTQPGH